MNVLTQRSHADLLQRRMDENNQGYRHRKEVVVTSRGISACKLAMATSTVAFTYAQLTIYFSVRPSEPATAERSHWEEGPQCSWSLLLL
jgi:hypothetical protein